MANLLESYAEIVGNVVTDHLQQLARPAQGDESYPCQLNP